MEANIHPVSLSEQVERARSALVSWFAENDPQTWRTVRELRQEVQNGWPPAAFMIAINRLIADGEFETDGSLRVRPAA